MWEMASEYGKNLAWQGIPGTQALEIYNRWRKHDFFVTN